MSEAAERASEREGGEGGEAKAKADPPPGPEVVGAGEKPPGRLSQALLEYGTTGIVVLLSLSALTYGGFAVAFMVGFEVEGASETAGALGAAAVGWALTKPIRIPVALALTPVVVAITRRVRGKRAAPKE